MPGTAGAPMVVPHAPVTILPADPVPLLLALADGFPGDEVIVQLDMTGARVHLRDADGHRPLARAATLTGAAHALGLGLPPG